MRVLITSDSYLPRLGGAEMHAFKLGLFLQKEGHEVHVFTSESGNESEDKKSPFPIIRGKYSRKPGAIFKFYKKLYREVKWADMVYSVYSYKIAAAVGIMKFFLKRPFVISLQGLGTLDMPGNSWFYSKVHSFYRAVSIKRADRNLASCLEFVDIAKRYTSADKILYLPNALDIEEFSMRPPNYDLLPFELKGRKIAATIRRLVPKNGIQFLIEAIPYVIKDFQNAIFFIIGWGKLENYLKNRVKELGIEKYVYFAGRIENNILPKYLGLADLVIFPSTAEATSIACLESMALGKPILASKVGGFPEMVQEGLNGYLVNLTDNLGSDYGAPMTLSEEKLKDFAHKIIKMLSDEKLLEQMGHNSRQIAELKFDWHKRIKEITKIFHELREKEKDGDIKKFYVDYSDDIIEKRLESGNKLRRYVHLKQYDSILNFVEKDMRVLDAGCGQGTLSLMMAEKGAEVTACDISGPNIQRCREYAEKEGKNIKFVQADIENLPFEKNSFDLVVSSHVLEHIPDFDKGLREVMRVTKKHAVIAIPTILNGCSLIQVGGGDFWFKRKKSWLAVLLGPIRVLFALVTGKEGVDEKYAGHAQLPHIFRFPWVMKNKIKKGNFKLNFYEASTLCLPMFSSLLPVAKFLDKYRRSKFLRNFGYGTTYVIEKTDKSNQ